jgi:isocitrate/isopropylmalate dehydrogenase
VALVPGNGVGPEVTAEARKVLDALELELAWTELDWGSASTTKGSGAWASARS